MEFGKQLSISDFKALHNALTLEIVRNPKNDKLFVTANGKTVAAVSTKRDTTKEQCFVELISEDTGDITWCLTHKHIENVVETL